MNTDSIFEIQIHEGMVLPMDHVSEPFYTTRAFIQSISAEKEVIQFLVIERQTRKLAAKLIFISDGDEALSLPSSPYGGIITFQSLPIDLFTKLVETICTYFKERLICKVTIQCQAQPFVKNQDNLFYFALFNAGFEVCQSDVNHHIPITNQSFESGIHRMEKRKLKKCREAGLKFSESKNVSTIHSFISDCRKEKGISINISLERLEDSIAISPGRYRMFQVFQEDVLIAASVAVNVTPDICYHYLPASLNASRRLSPMVFLVEGLYNHCLENKIKYLDLGISSLNGKPQVGLINFKERIGGVAGLKFRYSLNLS